MKKSFLVCAKRTAIGSFNGALSTVSASDMGAAVIKDILSETGIYPAMLDEVISGNILPAGCGQGLGRQVAIKAGVPYEVPAYAVSMACGSAMKAMMNAVIGVKAGVGNLYVAGGTESMSLAPYLLNGARSGYRMGNKEVIDHMVYDALTDSFNGYHMGVTAENVAKKYGITREEQDNFAYASQQKAITAVDGGAFKEEITPVSVRVRKEETIFDSDEYPNRKTTPEKLASLRPAFIEGGTVTAGNASGINDGAAYTMIASEDALKAHNLIPLFEIIGIGQGGVDPAVMGLGPVPAIAAALHDAKLSLRDIDLIELNEAFAAQSLGVVAELSMQHGMRKEEILARTNLNGGAIALGHPVGASGARIAVTLMHLMLKKGVRYGLASLCIGGGMGTAIILKNVR